MAASPPADVYSTREVALACGVAEEQVIACLDGGRGRSSEREVERDPVFLSHADAVRVGVALVLGRGPAERSPVVPLFAMFSGAAHHPRSRSVFALSGTVHATLAAILVLAATLTVAPRAAVLGRETPRPDLMQLVFLATPGPGGGGGGGGLQQRTPPPKAMREGHHKLSSPVPAAKPLAPAPRPLPPPPIASEPLPTVVAPIVSSPADSRSRVGVLERTSAENEVHGPGDGGGAGSGAGTGLGSGNGPGVGAGSGGGTGGGPYRPGSGIEPPRLIREVKADYTEDARRRGVTGEVELEIVVRRDGSVGDVKMLRGLGSGLDERAVQAVRQWRFAPATKQGAPVDVLVEVAVEFKLR